jgi:hypothetical protein
LGERHESELSRNLARRSGSPDRASKPWARHPDPLDDKPVRASGCLLPDGALVDAVCLAGSAGAQVWSRPIEGPRRRRRGRLIIAPGTALRFVDEPQADVPQKAYAPGANLARDLALSARIRACVQNDLFAGLLYAALCATKWRHCDAKATWSCSWRAAGGVVAGLRGDGDYLSWYCWGHEETLDEAVLAELDALCWGPVEDVAP